MPAIVLTREDANSESAILVEWLAADRAEVTEGQVVCVIETSKATIEVESPGTGTLYQLCAAGDEVELGGRIGYVAAEGEEPPPVDAPPDRAATAVAEGPTKATKKAVELAARHGIDLSSVRKDGFITAEDVEALLAGAGQEAVAPESDLLLDGISTEGVSLPGTFGLGADEGKVDPAFLDALRTDPDAFRALSSEERCERYRAAGASIGEGVTLGDGTLIVAPQIVLGDGVGFAGGGNVRCEETFAAGPLTHFGLNLEVNCRRAYFGASGWIGRNVVIGGGGSRDPWATFAAGDLLFVGDEAFVNVCRPVLIGREVFLTMRSVIVTHNVGHSLLEGFENRFAGVVLEDRAQVGIGAVVYAGCRVGAEAIVGSNSYVVASVPAGKLALGVPAKVVGSSSHPLSPERRAAALRKIQDDLGELLALRGVDVSVTGGAVEIRHDGTTSQVIALERVSAGYEPPAADGETVIMTLGLAGEPPSGCAVIDLLARRVYGEGGIVLDSVREVCRKRGIRLEPGPWRYTGGLV